ncbi:MAG: division/cell wall cluster transcriptional repressor MraZ [bacterium]|nr:division/cell wall cluster transcriptional repressor MraZ [bacterium]
MFYGEYQHTVDGKGRLTIPARLRETLRENFIDKFYITRGLDRCLFVFTPNDWKSLVAKFRDQPLTRAKAREFMRIFFAGASEVECDKQGRIMIPQNLIKWAGIQKDVVVVGLVNRLEIWDEATWRRFESEKGSVYEEIAETLIDAGF